MNKYSYIAALALCSAGLAQDRNPNQPQPGQTPPAQNRPEIVERQQQAKPAEGEGFTQKVKELFTDWRFEDLPPAVQKTVQAQSQGQKISDIDRNNRGALPSIWEIEFEQAGRNREIHISEDGTLLPEN